MVIRTDGTVQIHFSLAFLRTIAELTTVANYGI